MTIGWGLLFCSIPSGRAAVSYPSDYFGAMVFPYLVFLPKSELPSFRRTTMQSSIR